MKKTIEPAVYWIVVGAFLGTVISLTWGLIIYGETFLQGFLTNWLATFLGVIVGIPVAIWISSYQEKSIEKERKKKILALLKQELSDDVRTIRRHEGEKNILVLITDLCVDLKSEFWKAFSDGGDLQWIKDPELLGKIASAYNYVRMILVLCDSHFQLFNIRELDLEKKGISNVVVSLVRVIKESEIVISESIAAIEHSE